MVAAPWLYPQRIAVALVALVALVGGCASPAPSACTVGMTGTNAKVHFSGVGAEQECQRALDGGKAYRVSGPLTDNETERCSAKVGMLTARVTDTGMGIVASQICENLMKQGN
jgi:hypothetical protein